MMGSKPQAMIQANQCIQQLSGWILQPVARAMYGIDERTRSDLLEHSSVPKSTKN